MLVCICFSHFFRSFLSFRKAVGVGQTPQAFTAHNCTVTKGHFTIECYTAEGAGFSHLWEVLIGGQLNTPATTAYAAPIISNITGPGSSQADTSGNELVRIDGWNFGPPSSAKRESFLEKVTYGFTGREYTARDCKVISHKRIVCKTVPGVGTHNIWQVKVAGQTNDVLASPVTDYAVPKCWAMYDMIGSEESEPESKWVTNPDTALARIELRCEHTGLADSLASTRYIRYSLAGYERHIDLDMANTRRVGTPGEPGTYEQIRFVTPPLEWISMPAASVPVSLVLITASGEILETTSLKHTYGAPKILTEPTVTAGVPGLAGSFNVSLSGENFGVRGEVLRYDGRCNRTAGQICGTDTIRICTGGDIKEEDEPILCGWNIVPGVHQKFDPLIGGVFRYTHSNVDMTFKGLKGTVLIRRGGRLSQLRKAEKSGSAQPKEWYDGGYNWVRPGCTVPKRPSAKKRDYNKSDIGASTDPGTVGGSGQEEYVSTECDMGQASNNASFDALSPYITSLRSRITTENGGLQSQTDLSFPTIGHTISTQMTPPRESKLIVKCWYCLSQSAEIYIGGQSVDGRIIGGDQCNFDATQPNLADPEYANDPAKQAAIYTCEMPSGQGYEQQVWIVTDSGPSGLNGGLSGGFPNSAVPNVIHYNPPSISTFSSSYTCDCPKNNVPCASPTVDGNMCLTTKGGNVITVKGKDFGEAGNVKACTWGKINGIMKERCWPTTSVGTNHDTATFNIPAGIGGDTQAVFVRVKDQTSGLPGAIKKREVDSIPVGDIPAGQKFRYTRGVVVGSLMPPRRDPMGGYDVEVFGFDFAVTMNGMNANQYTKVWFGEVPCVVKSSKFDRIVCTMGTNRQGTGTGSKIEVWIGPSSDAADFKSDLPTIQKCRNASPQEKLDILNAQTSVRDTQLYDAVIQLKSKEISLVQKVVARTGGLANALVAADSLAALIASGKNGSIASSLQIDVLAQEDGRYLTNNGTHNIWVDVTPQQVQNADAAWATRDAALAEAEGTQDSFQARLLKSSKHADALALANYKSVGKGVDAFTTKVIEASEQYSTSTPTFILMMAAQNFGRVADVNDKVVETPTINKPLSSSETQAESTASDVGQLDDALEVAESKEVERFDSESISADHQILKQYWPNDAQCNGNLTCSMLRLRLKIPDPPRSDDLETVARSSECMNTDQALGGAMIHPTNGNWSAVLLRVRTGVGTTTDYVNVGTFCVESTKNMKLLQAEQKAAAKIKAARDAAAAGTATGAQLQIVIPGFFDKPYDTNVASVYNLGASANSADVNAVNKLTSQKSTSTNDFVNSKSVESISSQKAASNCGGGNILTIEEQAACDAEKASNPCYPDLCTTASAPEIRSVYIHKFNSTLNLIKRADISRISTNALSSNHGKTTHRILVEVRGANFGADESALNVSFIAYKTGGPFKYDNGWKQTAGNIHVPYSDILTREQILNAPVNSKLRYYTEDRDQNGQRDGFRNFLIGTRVYFWCPPGQGKDLVIRITRRVSSGVELSSPPSDFAVTYATPTIALGGVYTEPPYRYAPANSGPTDGCTTGSWESMLQWAARIEGVTVQERAKNPKLYGRKCTRWHTVVIEGTNFGVNASLLTVNAVIGDRIYPLHDGPTNYLKCSDSCGEWFVNPPPGRKFYYNRKCGSRPYFVSQMTHSHTKLVLCAPRGYGRNLKITVDVAGQPGLQAQPAQWNFEVPELTATFPNPYNGRGTETAVTKSMSKKEGEKVNPRVIEIRGNNFGAVENTPIVIIDGKECENPAWHSEHEVDGFPYITCEVQPNVVGAVNMSFFVADQWSKRVDVIENIRRAAIRSECIPGVPKDDGSVDHYWGREGELCTLCVKGEVCTPGTYLAPYAKPGFWLEKLDISGPTKLSRYPRATAPENGGLLLSNNDENDMKMAKGTYAAKVLRKCPKERLFDPILDLKMITEFPLGVATRKDTCSFPAACMPSEACNGSNTCHPNYEGKRLKCEAYTKKKIAEAQKPNSTEHLNLFSCNHTLQCRNRGFGKSGASCGRAIDEVCGCEPDWAASGIVSPMGCLKACIRTPAKLDQLLAAGCRSGDQLGRSLTGADCGGTAPEECSICVPSTDSTTGITTGQCTCQASRRCVWCTYGTHYRMEGKCEKCPENPELVVSYSSSHGIRSRSCFFLIFGCCVFLFDVN
jgi:hypothetical protein